MMPDYFHFLLTGKKVQEYTKCDDDPAGQPGDKGLG